MDIRPQVEEAPIPHWWIKFVNSDGSGLDAYVTPESIGGVIIEDPAEPLITIYMTGLLTAVKKGKSTELQDIWVEVRGQEATEVLAWVEQHCKAVITGSWTRRSPVT